MHTAKCVGRVQSFHLSTSPWVSTCSPAQKLSKSCPLGVFMEPSLPRHDWLDHWPLVIELNLHPLYPLWRSGGGTQSSKPLITWFVPLATSSSLGDGTASQVTSLTQLEKTPLWCLYHIGSPKDFRSPTPGTGSKPKYIFIIINHNINSFDPFYFVILQLPCHGFLMAYNCDFIQRISLGLWGLLWTPSHKRNRNSLGVCVLLPPGSMLLVGSGVWKYRSLV